MLGNVKTPQPKVVLATVGSLGDLHPFIALGLALRKQGAHVVLAGAAEYRSKVEGAGLAFHPVRPSFADMERRLGMDPAQLTRAVVARSDFLLRELVVPTVRVAYEDMLRVVAGADLLLTSSLSIGGRLAAERCAIPWIAVVLQPLMFLSAFDPPMIPRAAWLGSVLRWLGPRASGHAMRLAKRAAARMMRPVQRFRDEIGLPRTAADPLFDGQFSSNGTIALYSSVLGPVQPDYPRPTWVAGFASFDSEEGGAAALGSRLTEFLDAGTAPIVFTLGSLIVNSPGTFYAESRAAARRLGRRAVLLVGERAAPHTTGLHSADVHVCAYAPHSLLFPRAVAIVHQGGIGTLAQALRSGRPQLVVPFFADQLDNAARSVKLGVARSLSPRRYSAASAARELARLLGDSGYATRAVAVGARLTGEDGATSAAQRVMGCLAERAVAGKAASAMVIEIRNKSSY